MGAIITGKTTLLVEKLLKKARSLPNLERLTIESSETFSWNHNACAITYDKTHPDFEALLLHEFGHALLAHIDYSRDIDLIKIERDAWFVAVKLGAEFGIDVSGDLAEDSLDTYRDWLHSRSTCPNCCSTGLQVGSRKYRCLACRTEWNVNEARRCALRRYKV